MNAGIHRDKDMERYINSYSDSTYTGKDRYIVLDLISCLINASFRFFHVRLHVPLKTRIGFQKLAGNDANSESMITMLDWICHEDYISNMAFWTHSDRLHFARIRPYKAQLNKPRPFSFSPLSSSSSASSSSSSHTIIIITIATLTSLISSVAVVLQNISFSRIGGSNIFCNASHNQNNRARLSCFIKLIASGSARCSLGVCNDVCMDCTTTRRSTFRRFNR